MLLSKEVCCYTTYIRKIRNSGIISRTLASERLLYLFFCNKQSVSVAKHIIYNFKKKKLIKFHP